MNKTQKTNPTAKIFKVLVENKEVNFDLPEQRGYVWTRDKKSKLIESIFLDFPIPPIYANFKNGIYSIVDGKQRGLTIVGFQQDKFSLNLSLPITINGKSYNLAGIKFSELPEELRLIIEQFNMDLHFKENMTDAEQKEMFLRLNYGKPLTRTEITKAKIKSVTEVISLAKHNVFTQIMNERSLEASKNVSMIMQMYVALFEPTKCMLASSIEKSLKKTPVSLEEQQHIQACLDIFEKSYLKIRSEKSDITKKLSIVLKRKSHFIGFIYVISQTIKKDKCNIDTLILWVKHFFDSEADKTTISDEYNNRLGGAMNSSESVQIRLDAMYKDYQQFVKECKGDKK